MWRLTILFALISSGVSQYCNYRDTVNITGGKHLADGVIDFEGIKYGPKEYSTNKTNNEVRGCVCLKKSCLPKCCPMGEAYYNEKKKCGEWSGPFYNPIIRDDNLFELNINLTDHFHFVFGKPKCVPDKSKEVRTRMRQSYTGNSHINTNGKLYIEVPSNIPPWIVREPNKYCVDTFIFEVEGKLVPSFDAIACFGPDEETANYYLNAICMIISCVFILLTVTVYAWLPELRNLHGRVLMAYLLCIFVSFFFLATMQIMLKKKTIVLNMCVVFSFIIYFFLLAAFFWCNVMSFDIWWTFSGKRGITREKMSVRAKFCVYCLYAFGSSTALTILLISLEFSGLPPHRYLPAIRQHGCFLSGLTKLIYLYGPITFICVANAVFFTLTARKIIAIKQETAVLTSRESATHDTSRTNRERQRLCLYVKLFAVMGISWLLEVVSYFFPQQQYIWYPTDIYNLLIGLFVFVIFVCKRKILRLIRKRYKQLRGESISKSQFSTRTLSSTTTTRDEVALSTRN